MRKSNYPTSVWLQVSTCKEKHTRLGEDNLNDTLEYDFGDQPCIEEKLEELKAKGNDLMANQNACHVTETQFEDLMLLNGSFRLAPSPVIQPCVHNCSHSSPSCDLDKDVDNILAKNDRTADLKDNI